MGSSLVAVILYWTWNAFDTNFGPHWKDRENGYQTRQILALLLNISCSNFRLKMCQMSESYKNCQRNQIWMGLEQVTSKKLFTETIIHNILETNSSFNVKDCTLGKVQFLFFNSFLLKLTKFSFWESDCIRLWFYEILGISWYFLNL